MTTDVNGVPNTLQELQEERITEFREKFPVGRLDGLVHKSPEIIETFIKESIRTGWEAGVNSEDIATLAYENGYTACWKQYKDMSPWQVGFLAGIERAKELVTTMILDSRFSAHWQLGYHQAKKEAEEIFDQEINRIKE